MSAKASISSVTDEKGTMMGTASDSITEQHQPTSLSAPAHALLHREPPAFTWASLWGNPVVNHLNGKSQTINLLNFNNQYTRNFHLAWVSFFVAFLSWFAFAPLLPEAIKTDLNLTTAQIGNSNVVSLIATLLVRLFIGPLVDRYGPRKTMAAVLIIGAIPSGLAGTITSANGLYVIRFFIGILGATFVPCLAWIAIFFDKNVVGLAGGLVGGWGNMGGGITYIVQVALYSSLTRSRGLSPGVAWRTCFAVVPVPLLLTVAGFVLYFGTDHPAGKWEARHTLPATAIAAKAGHFAQLDESERRVVESKMAEKSQAKTTVMEAQDEEDELSATTDLDIAVAEVLTGSSALRVLGNQGTWLCAMMYMTTFGFELAVDANLAGVLFAAHGNTTTFTQEAAGYYGSVFGLLNLFTRPLGGYFGDLIYRRYGIGGKKWLALSFGAMQGFMSLGMGLWMRSVYNNGSIPAIGLQMMFVVLMAVFCELANGAIFSLVPHCNAFNNGFMTGLVGAMGNLGGIFIALMFRYNITQAYEQAWWIAGVFAIVVNLACAGLRVPKEL